MAGQDSIIDRQSGPYLTRPSKHQSARVISSDSEDQAKSQGKERRSCAGLVAKVLLDPVTGQSKEGCPNRDDE